jgi:Protein of unknown function (DUF2442)
MPQRQDEEFVWSDEQPDAIAVRAVEQLGNFEVRLQFGNGEVRQLDLERYLHGPIFEPLRLDTELFRRMHIEGGTLAWPNGADIAPETLYEDSHPVQIRVRRRTGKQ